MQGWIKLHRKIQESALWKQKRVFSKAEAWIDILMEVQHVKETEVIIGSKVLKCYRGQSLKSAETWGKRWCWSRNQVIRFFRLLRDCAQIATANEHITTRLTVLNYGIYQNEQTACEPKVNSKPTASEQQANTDKNVKNANNGNNVKEKAIFDIARKKFPNTKKGLQPEFDNFCKKHTDWRDVLPLLLPAIEQQIIWRKQDKVYWKHFTTWINGSCWTEENSKAGASDEYNHCQHAGCTKYWSKDDPKKFCSKHNIR